MGDFLAQFQSLKLRKEMLNAANIYLFEIIHTKCKYIDRSFESHEKFIIWQHKQDISPLKLLQSLI